MDKKYTWIYHMASLDIISKEQMQRVEKKVMKKISTDGYLRPYRDHLYRRLSAIEKTESELTQDSKGLLNFASGHEYFGLHRDGGIWIFREWAPNAEAIFLIGDFSGWQADPRYQLKSVSETGVWEIRLPVDTLRHRDLFRLLVCWPGGRGDRIPAFARLVHQDEHSLIFNAQVWDPEPAYSWLHASPPKPSAPLIYEAHVGMALEKEGIGSYVEFTETILPRIKKAGYNILQLMAIQQHPYYASFGYHVSSFFAASSRFGTPDELKALIDNAHGMGLYVLIDLVHSHSVSNEVEGLSRFDGSTYQYFHAGPRGYHTAWDSRCFDYGKPQVLHFLLSNCRFWLDEYHVDGFRFDGVTSMLYVHHGLQKAFTSYDDYFNDDVDDDALVYLALANRVIHEVRPDAITIAEDVSGMPGLASPDNSGGFGFDYRFAMGLPDHWIRLVKDQADADWHMGGLWFELTNRRHDEKTISYAEAHDQALVGDQSLMFRLAGQAIYAHMRVDDAHVAIDRAVALHKMIRLITLASAGHGYLNFMGNEFGHPEWIDFPRSGNGWSFRYARRQWHLADDPGLRYFQLNLFDREMIEMAKAGAVLETPNISLLHEHNDDKVIAFERADLIFAFNFHPNRSFSDYSFFAPAGSYRMILDSDAKRFGGHDRLIAEQIHHTLHGMDAPVTRASRLSIYLPSRTAIVLRRSG